VSSAESGGGGLSPEQLREVIASLSSADRTYGTTVLDLTAWGPTVIEAPPQSLCVVDDFWFRYVADMGIAGPDKGEGEGEGGKICFSRRGMTARCRMGTSSIGRRRLFRISGRSKRGSIRPGSSTSSNRSTEHPAAFSSASPQNSLQTRPYDAGGGTRTPDTRIMIPLL
jgi:Protein of unknown function (DUF1254)